MTTAEALTPNVTLPDARPLTALEVRSRVNLMQEVMKAVMKEGVHYGVIPGTQKPTLFKPGAEVALVTFRIAAMVKHTEDIGIPGDEVRYRVIVQGVHQVTGEVLGEGAGECSSNEEKYKWRRPVHANEYNSAPIDRRRDKFTKNGDVWKQVRTEPADVANTILKMAVKRALVAMTLVVTAASDVFTQDIEDLPEELRENISDATEKRTPVSQPQRVQPTSEVSKPAEASSATKPPFNPSATYLLRRTWKPNANKDYRFLELVSRAGSYTVHVWDADAIKTAEVNQGRHVTVTGKASNFDAAPFQVKTVTVMGSREPGQEG